MRQRWRDMRSKLTPSFTSSKMKTMFGLMSDCCKQMVDFLEERQHNSDPGCNITKENNVLVLELKEFFTRYANDVIATTAFGVSVDSLKQPKNKFFMMGQEATNMGSWRFFAFFTIPKIMEFLGIGLVSEHVTKFFRSLVVDTMKTREKLGIVRPDMLQLLMEAKKNSLQDSNTNGNKKPLDEDDIVAQAVLFFLAGFDTVSTLMCFTCFMLATHPEVHQKLQDEIDRTFEENNGKFTYELLNNMKYLDMVVSETLRIYPPNESVDRICVRKYTLKADPPLELHPGDNLLIPILGLHRDPKYYPEPENFDPERFSDENKHKINPSTYLPFGVGPRSCIGNRFALMETKMAMVHMLSKFNIKTVNKTPKSINIIQKEEIYYVIPTRMSILEWQWSSTDWALLIIAVAILLYYLGTMSFSHFSKRNIPHPKPVPFLGNMAKTVLKGKSFPDQILEMYDETKHHQYAGFYMFQVPILLINDPELIKTITVKDFEYFTDHRVFFNEKAGHRWRDMRSKLSPAFTSSKMKTMFTLISECCKQLVDFLEESGHKSDPGCNILKENNMLVLELKEFFTRYTNDVIATTAFGVGVDSLKQPKNEFFMMGQEATNFGPWRFFGFFVIPKIMELLGIGLVPGPVTKFFRSLVLDTMKTREKQGIAVLFFLAGFDTASTLLCFTCYMIATHPEVHQKLQDEVDRTYEENGEFTYEAVNNMKYLDMVVSETLRIYPPGGAVDRICTQKYTLQADTPLEFVPGDNLFIPIFGLHRDPKYYPEPEKFDPERFNDENKHKINPFTYLPFGVGPRSCIGNRFALMETKLVLVMSILEWQWSLTDLAIVVITILIFLYYLGTRTYDRFSKYNIPHERPLPFIGNMAPTLLENKAFTYTVRDMYNATKDHPYGGFYMFQVPIILINDTELIKTIAVKDFDYFTDHRSFVTETAGDTAIWAKGLVSLKGQRWKDMRSKLSPAFTSSKMKTMFVLISDCCKQLVDFLEEAQNKPNPGSNIKKATTAFGVGVDSLRQPKNEFFAMGQRATNFGPWRFFGFFIFPKLMQMLGIGLVKANVTKFFRSLVLDTIHTRETQGIVRHDMLQLLMEAKKNSDQESTTNGKKIIDDDDIVAQAVLFFLAGFDTASSLMCFVCYMLATHPEVHKKLQDEVDSTLKENNGKFTYEVVNNMKYLDMVVSETLRIYPPAGAVDRICTRRYTLKADPPLECYPGDNLFIPIFGLHHEPKYFPEPEKFDPERFSDENKHKINPFAYLPFGNRFALMETKLVLAYMLSKFNIRTVNKTPKTIKVIQKGFNISIAGGFWMGIESRKF
ncbi:hypothetical protein C0J52_06738 [Blattella germanica]|nr:hypothetical protein C0J52_06738 [Blattella germanica]